MKIGDRVLIRGTIDEIRRDTVIIKNEGGYFGTVPEEIVDKYAELTKEEMAILQKWRDNRGISMEDFEQALSVLQEQDGGKR